MSSTALQWGAIVIPAVAAAAFVAWRIHVESEKTRDLLVRPSLVFHSLRFCLMADIRHKGPRVGSGVRESRLPWPRY